MNIGQLDNDSIFLDYLKLKCRDIHQKIDQDIISNEDILSILLLGTIEKIQDLEKKLKHLKK